MLFSGEVEFAAYKAAIIEFVNSIPGWVLEPFFYSALPGKRLYWLFILSSLVLALIALYWRYGVRRQRSIWRMIFSSKYWLTRSTALDLSYLFLNSFVRSVVLIPLLGSKIFATILVARFFQKYFDTPPDYELSALTIMLFYTLCFFLAEDVSRYFLHLALHKVPWLWRFHKIHHSATTLTPITLHRVHPLEMSLYFIRGLGVFAFVSGLFIYLFGSKVSSVEILGVGALGFLFNLIGANLRHSHIWLGFGPLEKIFISPAQHQLHHSRDPSYRDINLGTCLAIWDRLMGTWRQSGKRPLRLRFGLNSGLA